MLEIILGIGGQIRHEIVVALQVLTFAALQARHEVLQEEFQVPPAGSVDESRVPDGGAGASENERAVVVAPKTEEERCAPDVRAEEGGG